MGNAKWKWHISLKIYKFGFSVVNFYCLSNAEIFAVSFLGQKANAELAN